MTKLDDYIVLRVKEKRIALGWSQQELANNINRGALHRYFSLFYCQVLESTLPGKI
jgi:hypothetical protein